MRSETRATSQGFALLEVLIAMLVAAVALLGLAQLEVRAVQGAQSSLDYAIATTRLNNLTEQIRANLCNNRSQATVYQQTVNNWKAGLPAGGRASIPLQYADNMIFTLSWQDTRLTTGNSVTINPVFPDICN